MNQQIVSNSIREFSQYNRVLEGNKRYVEKKLTTDDQYFKKLSTGQSPKYLLIGCSDSRAPPNELTETDPGEIFIHRNIANLVIPTDLNLNCVIQYAVEHLNIHSIIVMGHTCCGGIKAAMAQESVGGLLDLWLNQIKIVYEKHQDLIESLENEEDRLDCLSQLNVRAQVMNIWKNPIIQKSWQKGNPIMVHGWLFRVETGYIEELLIDSQTPYEMNKVFALKFKLDSERILSKQTTPLGSPKNNARKRFQFMQKKIIQHIKQQKENTSRIEKISDLQQISELIQNCQEL
ncbi:unnamed protein product [Paramecium pentaurelia]|uniref:Carbonic anhydrase n=1 Tax=Paramecium pentaurelia TaxID=43138 RepID=A0A8S1SKR7_9CILI|nr:unnamed protein product [Paramecium pentaurelia]